MVSAKRQRIAQDLLNELFNNSLEVCLIPAPDKRHSQHYIRAVESANAKWYQKFCSEYPSSRRGFKTRTAIKRRETVRALESLANGVVKGVYGERLVEFINRNYLNPPTVILESDLFPIEGICF